MWIGADFAAEDGVFCVWRYSGHSVTVFGLGNLMCGFEKNASEATSHLSNGHVSIMYEMLAVVTGENLDAFVHRNPPGKSLWRNDRKKGADGVKSLAEYPYTMYY